MSKIRVCFLGTPQFAAVALKSLFKDPHYEVVGVVTQPDRPAGRKLQLTPSPVKVLAQAHNVEVLAPESLKSNQLIIEEIKKWRAEVAIVVAYGQILTEEFLNMFPFGAVNVHGSLLPKWRGAAPIQRSIEAGDKETGVALQKIVKKLDAGDVLGIRKIDLDDEINAQELYDRLAILGADLLHVELMDYLRGNLAGEPQDEHHVTFAKKIDKTESEIQWGFSSTQIHNKVRAFAMGPGTFTTYQGKKFKIHKTKVENTISRSSSPGTILKAEGEDLIIQCEEGTLRILEIQPDSRQKMNVIEFLKGSSWKSLEVLGG